jgi:N-acetylmuramoyl-L-alanine amidase
MQSWLQLLYKQTLILFLFIILTSQSTSNYKIIFKPINYNQERIQLSLNYLKERHGIIQKTPKINPKVIVLHYTAGGNLKSNFDYFNQVKIEGKRTYNKTQSELNVSAHYLVDRDGTIYNLVPDTLFARHAIGLNYCAIGVENIGSKQEPLTQDQVKANAQLVRQLKRLYNIEYLIGHNEYTQFRKSALWKETNLKYITIKEDPGKDFMIKVRALVKDLKLKATP